MQKLLSIPSLDFFRGATRNGEDDDGKLIFFISSRACWTWNFCAQPI